ncbi:MAG: threonine/serine exporter family protein [Caldilineaceae bacterium]
MSDLLALWPFVERTFWAGIAALGFSILFNVPVRTLAACALAGSLAYLTRTLMAGPAGLSAETATLIGATLVGFASVGMSRRLHVPAPVLVMPGVIPLIPGALAFRTMIDLLNLTAAPLPDEALVAIAAVNTIRTILIIGAIAVGVAIPSLIFRRRHPMT